MYSFNIKFQLLFFFHFTSKKIVLKIEKKNRQANNRTTYPIRKQRKRCTAARTIPASVPVHLHSSACSNPVESSCSASDIVLQQLLFFAHAKQRQLITFAGILRPDLLRIGVRDSYHMWTAKGQITTVTFIGEISHLPVCLKSSSFEFEFEF